jgi:uncharacterized damage-inducible protein DinB
MRDYATLIDYNYWARDRLLDALAPLSSAEYLQDRGNSFRSLRDTAVHIYSGEWAWYSRWRGESPSGHVPADRFPDVPSLREAWSTLEREVSGLLTGLDAGSLERVYLDAGSLERVYDYQSFSGAVGRASLAQMVEHVVNHGSYHRGQITTMLRQAGLAAPLSMDLMVFFRERRA